MQAERLRRTRDIALVRSEGSLRSDRHFTLRARPNGLGLVRLAVSATRAIDTSVGRNRAKRRVREAFRRSLGERREGRGTDLFVVVRPAALAARPEEIRGAVDRELDAALGPDRP